MYETRHWLSFQLEDEYFEPFKEKRSPLAHNPLAELVFFRTYSRIVEGAISKKEDFVDVLRRCVEGAFSLQKDHILNLGLGWNEAKAKRAAKTMFDHMFNLRFLPAGRGLWMMGTKYAHTRTSMGLFNCAFVCTEDIQKNYERPFTFLMDVSMLGVGCGFSTLGSGKMIIREPRGEGKRILIEDSREGWVTSTGKLIRSYIHPTERERLRFDYTRLRLAGESIKGFGGVAAGPEPLIRLHERIRSLFQARLEANSSETPMLDSRLITDIMNLIGECVVAGNIRRTAELALGEPEDAEFLSLKDYVKNPERQEYGRFSNNSVYARIGMDYRPLADLTITNGEPGYIWLDNIQAYGRMEDPPDFRDQLAKGCNPCVEQTLESYEVCNLVEIFPPNIKSKQEFLDVVKCAYLYGKSVTLVKTHLDVTNRVQLKNRRIGLSLSGLAQFREAKGIHELIHWMDEGYKSVRRYDEVYSDWLAIPRSIKTTCVKPSGTLSILAGTTAGIHFPISKYFVKNLRLSKHSPLLSWAKDCGFHVEPEQKYRPDQNGGFESYLSEDTVVVTFPVQFSENLRGRSEVSIWEQVKFVEIVQRFWADNQVSSTVTFNEDEKEDVLKALELFDRDLKNISFFPNCDAVYPQMPEVAIDAKEYGEIVDSIQWKPILPYLQRQLEEAIGESGCTNDTCSL